MKLFITVIAVIFAVIVGVFAQENRTEEVVCSPEDRQLGTDAMQGYVESMQAALDADDTDAWFTALRDMRFLMGEYGAYCYGLSFSSAVNGIGPVIGPITIPKGFWILRGSASGSGGFNSVTVSPSPISDGCGSDLNFAVWSLDVDIDTENFLDVETDCQLMIEVHGTEGLDWRLFFDPLELEGE